MKTLFLILLAVAGSALAQTTAPSPALAPELAPLAAKHQADLAVVEQQRAAAVARSLPFYASALDAEGKAALARSNLDAVAAIDKEREAVKAGLIGDLVAAPFPDKLPANLKTSRAAFFESYKHIEADVLKLRQQVNAEYLRALTALEPRAAGKPELVRQIKAEHDAVLGNPVTTQEGEVEVATKTGKLINGDFSQADGSGFPIGWKLVDRNGSDNPPPAGETYKVVQENNRSFLHTAREDPKGEGVRVWQVVDVPSYARQCELKFLARSAYTGEPSYGTWAALRTLTKDGKTVTWPRFNFKADASWKTYSAVATLDQGKTIKQVRVELNTFGLGGVKGSVDYSRVELHFK